LNALPDYWFTVLDLVVTRYTLDNRINVESFIGTGFKYFGPYLFDGIIGSRIYHPIWKSMMANVKRTIEAKHGKWMIPKSLIQSHNSGALLLGKEFKQGGWIANTKNYLEPDIRHYMKVPKPRTKGILIVTILFSIILGSQIYNLAAYSAKKRIKKA
jgi:hypothetical protein